MPYFPFSHEPTHPNILRKGPSHSTRQSRKHQPRTTNRHQLAMAHPHSHRPVAPCATPPPRALSAIQVAVIPFASHSSRPTPYILIFEPEPYTTRHSFQNHRHVPPPILPKLRALQIWLSHDRDCAATILPHERRCTVNASGSELRAKCTRT
jgi:hypothetical protein